MQPTERRNEGGTIDRELGDVRRGSPGSVGALIPATDHEPIRPVERARVFPLSFAQQRLWFIDRLDGGSAPYHMYEAWRLRGSLDVEALRAALNILIRRHEALRTVFREVNGDPVQEVLEAREFTIEVADLRAFADTEREQEQRKRRQGEVSKSFDLETGPLIRGGLFRIDEDEYVLFIVMHHMICDGWSVGILMQEMKALYAAYSGGSTNGLAAPLAQYSDYVEWERSWAASTEAQPQITYWKRQLKDAPSLIDLPVDRQRAAVQSYRGGSIDVSLGRELKRALSDLARARGVTLAMILLSGLSILLSKLSGQEDLVIGIPIANRRRKVFEDAVGLFVNTLAIRIRVSEDKSVVDLLRQVRKSMIEAYDNQDAPFGKVVEELHPERSLSHNPVFQVMLALQIPRMSDVDVPGVTWTRDDLESNTTQFDLSLLLQEDGNDIVGSMVYSTDLFNRATAFRWREYFRSALKGMLRDPEGSVGRVRLVDDDEMRRVVASFAAAEVPYPSEQLVHQLFEDQVARTPDATALVYGGHSLTYADLNRRANRLARYLVNRGIGPDKVVGICVERGLEMIVGLLGILKAGGVYVPLDPSYPPERLQYMLADAAPRVLLTQERLKEVLPHTDAEVIALDQQWEHIARQPGDNLDAEALGLRCHHLAYVIYTSGSTGQPKGVMIEHRHILNLWQGLESAYRRSAPCQHIALNASLNFDASVQQWVQLLSGRTLFVIPEKTRRDAPMLLRFFSESQIHGVDCTPSQLKAWISTGLLETDGCSVRMVLVGGESIDNELWSNLAQCSGTEFYNVYGPTECTVDCTIARLKGDATTPHIGHPMENRHIYVLDRNHHPAPIGVTGEIYIGGAGVARGYLNRPELTAERFISDLFSSDSSRRLYKTGDLGRWRSDGRLEYLGRNDHQVKIRGFRIELGEIEAQLRTRAEVREAVVLAREDTPGQKRLVAYVVGSATAGAESAALAEQLRGHLKAVLPEHMIPGAFVMLESLPLTSNGKLDRKALPAPDGAAHVRRRYEAPQGEVEEMLARIWQELLHVDRVGREDNFFELGGHSLLVLPALSMVKKCIPCALHVTDLYRAPQLRELAAQIEHGVTAAERIDLSREATLDNGIVANYRTPRAPAEAILLTGCTGFVGRFLLMQLLRDTGATIYCLVRAPSSQKATERIKAILSRWDLWDNRYRNRIIAIPSDLGLPKLGIDPETYRTMCQSIDCIFHCAASVNHLETYDTAKRMNVGSARELLAFATQQIPKVVNYMSTLDVFTSDVGDPYRKVSEESSIEQERHSSAKGYDSSKWVAENIFIIAQERGIPCNIFRLGLVGPDTHSGRYDESQREYRIVKSCLLTGYGIKNYRFTMPLTPVDYVARSIVFLANKHHSGRGVFHLASITSDVKGVFERCNEVVGASLDLISLPEWIGEIRRRHDRGETLPVMPLVEFVSSMDGSTLDNYFAPKERIQFDCHRTHRELEEGGILLPELDDGYMRRFLRNMILTDTEVRKVAGAVGG